MITLNDRVTVRSLDRPLRRYNGLTGRVIAVRGTIFHEHDDEITHKEMAYEVDLRDGVDSSQDEEGPIVAYECDLVPAAR